MYNHFATSASRRSFLRSVSSGFGALAFAGAPCEACNRRQRLAVGTEVASLYAGAKRVLFLCMEGGPSHVDSFDYKPELIRQAGKPLGKGRIPSALLVPPVWDFKQRGQSGLWISELFPELAGQADRLCIINSMQTDIPAHPAAFLQLHTGISASPRPSLGAWILYGLGTENANLPGFVTICAPPNNGGTANYGSAFLPAALQGTAASALTGCRSPTPRSPI